MSGEEQNTSGDWQGSVEIRSNNDVSGPSLPHHENIVSLAPSHEVLHPQVNHPGDQDRSAGDQIFGDLLNRRKVSDSTEPLVFP